MKGKIFLWNAHQHRIIDVLNGDDFIIVSTDRKIYRKTAEQWQSVIDEFLPVDNSKIKLPAKADDSKSELAVPVKNNNTEVVIYDNIISKNLTPLTETVRDSIDKLKNDGSFIKQADAINRSINTMINLAKLQLQAYSLSKKNGGSES